MLSLSRWCQNWAEFLDILSSVRKLFGVLCVGNPAPQPRAGAHTHTHTPPHTGWNWVQEHFVPEVVTSLFYSYCSWQWKGQALLLLASFLLLHNQVCWRLLVFLHVSVASSIWTLAALPVTTHTCSFLRQLFFGYQSRAGSLEFTSPHSCHLYPAGSQWLVTSASRKIYLQEGQCLRWILPTGSSPGWGFTWNRALAQLFLLTYPAFPVSFPVSPQ